MAGLNLSIYDTAPEALVRKYSEKELRKEYSRLRSIARKRLARLGKSRYAERSQTYQKYRTLFREQVPNIKRARTLARKIQQVTKYLSLRESGVSGIRAVRKERIKALQERGYTWINDDNFDAFTDFMDDNRARKKGGLYDSERVLELVRETSERRMDPDAVLEDFEFWMDNLKGLSQAPKPPESALRTRTGSSAWVRSEMKKRDLIVQKKWRE